jgi:hypothetical protein
VKQLLLRVLLSLQAPPCNNRAMCCRELPCSGHLVAAGCLDGRVLMERDANKNNCSLCSRANIVALRSGGTHSNNISNANNIITVITTHTRVTPALLLSNIKLRHISIKQTVLRKE